MCVCFTTFLLLKKKKEFRAWTCKKNTWKYYKGFYNDIVQETAQQWIRDQLLYVPNNKNATFTCHSRKKREINKSLGGKQKKFFFFQKVYYIWNEFTREF